ncbi:Arginyl-tRNA synthetase [Desulfamplus magnetovallimortis]|uniref:Arginine--tRNA ligase n=1 Tax=Desulfamplus magnetovallimortis TaxID=1246637 RepID=A0A1W1HA06_9BACT|nr:arginine--tRNA ligase [Desulfamplus magnetovallimortis]SLM29324.1 Arginyl-tRNA synthetase [Desulfamplus magnetovallimortis]
MKNAVRNIILNAFAQACKNGLLKDSQIPEMEIEVPRHKSHGDFSTNVAMVSASIQKMAPRKIAEAIVASIHDPDGIVEKTEIAGPGFINIVLKKSAWYPILSIIHKEDKAFGSSEMGQGRKVQVEFVSANPTGPLHIGHGRGAAVGDAVGNILAFAGFDVSKEYYINDSGRQIRTLGRSVWLRLCEAAGKNISFPDDCYQGDYICDIARELIGSEGNSLLKKATEPDAEKIALPLESVTEENDSSVDEQQKADALASDDPVALCAKYAADKILQGIKDDLSNFGVTFDRWFSEQSLYDSGMVQDSIKEYKNKGVIYEKDGALWFKTQMYGDEKDRVVVRQNGLTTYFASDIAYHMEKFNRGFDRVIDVWGADHHGYINRINASIEASGRSREQFDVILVQLVNLLRAGEQVAMSTRSGEFVTLKDIVDEVGRDAARFIFLSRSYDSGLDFDLEVAKQQTSENPVYYVQYVHARISGMVARACEQGILSDINALDNTSLFEEFLHLLVEPEEINLIKLLSSFSDVVEKGALTLHPHVLFTYLMSLASEFHAYYNKHKVITDNMELSLARLFLVSSVKKVIRNALGLLGVSAPERM